MTTAVRKHPEHGFREQPQSMQRGLTTDTTERMYQFSNETIILEGYYGNRNPIG